MDEKVLSYIVTNFGLSGFIIFLVVISFIKFPDLWIRLWNKIFMKFFHSDNRMYRSKDILLSKLIYWLDFKLDNLSITFNDQCRNIIFRDLLKIWFSCTKNHIFMLSDDPKLKQYSSPKLYSEIIFLLSTIREDFLEKANKEKIPQIVIQKFEYWLNKNLEFCLKHIELICNSEIYETNQKKLEAVYTICISVLEITLAEAEKTLKDINGQLNGIEYKGCICRSQENHGPNII